MSSLSRINPFPLAPVDRGQGVAIPSAPVLQASLGLPAELLTRLRLTAQNEPDDRLDMVYSVIVVVQIVHFSFVENFQGCAFRLAVKIVLCY